MVEAKNTGTYFDTNLSHVNDNISPDTDYYQHTCQLKLLSQIFIRGYTSQFFSRITNMTFIPVIAIQLKNSHLALNTDLCISLETRFK